MLKLIRDRRVTEVVFIDDFFRTQENGLHPASMVNRKILKSLFGSTARRLGWLIREEYPVSQGGRIPVTDIMKCLNLPLNQNGWSSACVADLHQAKSLLSVLGIRPGVLLIGWGLTPAIMNYIDDLGASFIDVEIYGIRFAKNLCMAARTNDPIIYQQININKINDEIFFSSAAELKTILLPRNAPSVIGDDVSIGLFVGQLDVDLALVHNGQLAKPIDFINKIIIWSKEVDVFVFKSHPACANIDNIKALLEIIPNSILVDSNIYALLSAENIKFVSGISSSVLQEAEYMGCTDIRRLILDDRNNRSYLPNNCSSWMPVSLEIAGIASMKSIGGYNKYLRRLPFLSKNNPPASTFSSDTLDRIFIYRWGLDLSANALPYLPLLSVDQRLSFASNSPGAACIKFGWGWHQPEDWGVWSSESYASIVVAINGNIKLNASDGLKVSIGGRAYNPGTVEPPVVEIFVNGVKCQYFDTGDDGGEWATQINNEVGKVLIVVVKVSGALKISDVGGNPGDTRTIGLGLNYIALEAS